MLVSVCLTLGQFGVESFEFASRLFWIGSSWVRAISSYFFRPFPVQVISVLGHFRFGIDRIVLLTFYGYIRLRFGLIGSSFWVQVRTDRSKYGCTGKKDMQILCGECFKQV